MNTRPGVSRILLYALFLSVLAVPAVHRSSADELSERIRQIQADIERTRKELESGEQKLEKLKDREQRGLEELELLEKTIQSVNQNLNSIKTEERSLEKRIAGAQAEYETSRKALDQRADTYAEHIKSMYRRRKRTTMASILRAGSASVLMRGIVMVRAVARADMDAIDTWRTKTAQLKEARQTLEQALDAKRKLANAKQREQITLKSSSTKKQQVIDSIRRDEKQQETMNKQYRSDITSAQEELDRFIRDREQAKLPVAPSLRNYNFATYKGKLIWPVAGKVVSTFGRTVDPRSKTVTNNRGIEIATGPGEPVHAIGRGEVVMTQYLRGYGNFILVSHPPSYYSVYGHLADILVSPGQILKEGEIIGIAGNTGLMDDTTPLLALEILQESTPQNPLSWLAPDARRASR